MLPYPAHTCLSTRLAFSPSSFCADLLVLVLCFLPWHASAVKFHNRDANHRGLVESGIFQIYPENQEGNGLYLNGLLIISKIDRTLISAKNIKNTSSTVYLYSDFNQELALGLADGPEDGKGRLRRVDAEFYEYTNYDLGIQRVFRLLNGRIYPVYENLRTAAGVTVSNTHAIFYHITESGKVEDALENGSVKSRWYFKFRLHLAKRGQPGVANLPGIRIENDSARLRLFWQNDHILGWRKNSGEIQFYDLRVYAPEMF